MANCWTPAGSVLGGAAHLAGMVAVMRGTILVQPVCTPRDACGRARIKCASMFCVLTCRGDAILYCAAAGGTPRGRHVRQKRRRGNHQASSEAAHRCYGGELRTPPPRPLFTFLISFLRSLCALSGVQGFLFCFFFCALSARRGNVCAQAVTVS